MTNNDLRDLLDTLTTFTWREDGDNLHGTSPSALIVLSPTHAQAMAVVPDETGVAVLLMLLTAFRYDWPVGDRWLLNVLDVAPRSMRNEYVAHNYVRGVVFGYDRASKQATLRITRRSTD